ncbi:MAG TPA: molybdopterin cofactor-binding domain-containing protein [Gemmatimonadales bacterium]|nr:molybdopterin cofactor-binding domain-containing protein [Gemmatimonadales bacterium]
MRPDQGEMIVPEGWGFVTTMDRREFVTLTSVGLLVMFGIKPTPDMVQAKWNPAGMQEATSDFNAFIHIGADGRVTVLVGKIEMGQGVMTSLPQLAAEELNVPLTAVDVVLGDTDLCPFDRGTFGSLSVRSLGPVLRAAAAEARAVLTQMAAERLQVDVADLEVKDGVVVSRKDQSKHVSYGELAAGKRIERKLEGKAALERVADFTVVGSSTPRRDALAKVTGAAKYAGDVVPTDALHARIVRPPAHGATITAVDTSAAERLPGVRVIRTGDLLAVLHRHRDEADAALRAVKVTATPSPSRLTNDNIFDHLEAVAPAGRAVAQGGNVADGERNARQVVTQKYLKGYVSHAAMETHSAVAQVGADGRVTVWASTQTPFPLQTQVARTLNVPLAQVRIITPYVGGGFGGKSAGQQALEAAQLAVVAKQPVRVVWDRDEEFFFDTFDPAAVISIRAGLDTSHKIVSWNYEVIGAGGRGAEQFYDIPHHRTVVRGGWQGNDNAMHPFAIGPWRAPGANANCFARESHIDQLAVKSGMDPVAFRMLNLSDARMKRVLQAAADKFGWRPAAAPSRRGYGVALGIDAGTYVATIVEVAVAPATGALTVERMVCAQDMGVVVNPEGAMQQMEGCLTMGLGYALSEEVRFANGQVLDRNFGTYTLPHFSWLPKIETVILDSPDTPAQGGGEPAIVTVGAALANAVFDATGARVVQLPLTEARVKAALARA